MSSRLSVFAVALTLAVLTPSCGRIFQRKAKAVPPPPAITQPLPAATVPAPKPQVVTADPPQISPQQQQIPPLPAGEAKLPGPPPRPVKARTTKETATPAEAQPAQPAPVIPQLEQMLSPDQQRKYNEDIDRNIGSAQKMVAVLNARKLTREQSGYLDRVVAFIQQANEARKTDLLRARNLAERANVLAEDLLRSIQ